MFPVSLRNDLQRMFFVVFGTERNGAQHVRTVFINQTILLHPAQDLMQIQLAVFPLVHDCIHID